MLPTWLSIDTHENQRRVTREGGRKDRITTAGTPCAEGSRACLPLRALAAVTVRRVEKQPTAQRAAGNARRECGELRVAAFKIERNAHLRPKQCASSGGIQRVARASMNFTQHHHGRQCEARGGRQPAEHREV